MTVSVSGPGAAPVAAPTSVGVLPGFRALVRKELMEWRRSRRTWVVTVVSALMMALIAMNAWLQVRFTPQGGADIVPPAALDPLANVVTAVSGQIFLIAAVFAVIALIAGERDSGTLAWTASKPVSRTAIWLAKFGSATAVLWVAAGVIPLGMTTVVVAVLYGAPPLLAVAAVAAGMGLAIALYVAVALAAATLVSSQAAVAGIALAVMFLPQLAGLFVPPDLLPTSILEWSMAAAIGEPLSVVTPLIWAISVSGLVAFSVRRMERMEL